MKNVIRVESDPHGPIFITEPSSHVDFSNFTGTRIECVAHGNPLPVIKWIHADGAPVSDVPALRQQLRNGTLHFLPFRGEEYKSSVHVGVYRCTASNSVGTIVSREVNVRADAKHIIDDTARHGFLTSLLSGIDWITDDLKSNAGNFGSCLRLMSKDNRINNVERLHYRRVNENFNLIPENVLLENY
uniref:Ig-like domain-containing protein n=1 Tax=Strigamia maritima TaxID=126957 RepID=T1JI47_STRMM